MITLKTLTTATEQEVFDQVAVHMLTQKVQSIRAGSCTCSYRGGEQGNLMCAAGSLIADEEYDPSWDQDDGVSWDALVANGSVPDSHEFLIAALQSIHDDDSSPWEADLRKLAVEFNLNTDAIDRLVQS